MSLDIPYGPLAFSANRPAGGGGGGPVPPIQEFNSWQALTAALVAGDDIGRLLDTTSRRITEGLYRTTGDPVVARAKLPTAEIRWDFVTPTQVAFIAGVTDPQNYTLSLGHNLPASGIGRPWQISTGTNLVDVSFTVVGLNLSLSAPRALAIGDLFYGVQSQFAHAGKPSGQTGEFDIDDAANGGDIQPGPNARIWFDRAPNPTGLRHTNNPLNQSARTICLILPLPADLQTIDLTWLRTAYANGSISANAFNQFFGFGYRNSTFTLEGGMRDAGGGNRQAGMKRGVNAAPTLVGGSGNFGGPNIVANGFFGVEGRPTGATTVLTEGGASDYPPTEQNTWASTTGQTEANYNRYIAMQSEVDAAAGTDAAFTFQRTVVSPMIAP